MGPIRSRLGNAVSQRNEQVLNPLDNLNFDDIESISILKDASASVYGFRGADGVVLITTKQGRTDQPAQISVDGYYGWQNFTRFPFNPHATAYEFQRAWVQSEQNLGDQRTISAEELEKWRIGTEPSYQSFNQYDVVINNPNAPQYQLTRAFRVVPATRPTMSLWAIAIRTT